MKIIVTAYMLILLSSSLIPMNREIRGLGFIINLEPTVQNMLHVPAFAGLVGLWMSVLKTNSLRQWRKVALSLLIGIILAFVTELVQFAVPGRYPGVLDLILDIIGIGCGMVLYLIIIKFQPGFCIGRAR